MNLFKKMYKSLDNVEEWAIVFMILTMTIITFANVLSRKVFMQSWSFVEEITTNFLVWIVFLGASVAAKRRAHLGLTLLTDFLPFKIRRYVALFVTIITVIFFAVMFYYGTQMIGSQIRLAQKTPSLGLPQWWMSLSLPVGAFLLMLRFLEVGIKDFLKKGEN